MSANPQWDISRALGVAKLFHLVCGVRDACVTPFLTLYLRQLGLAAPWVGILMGTKHLIAAFWGPFCAFLAKSYQKRRVLLMGSLLGSVGASMVMVLVPPLHEVPGYRSCNASDGATPTALPPGGRRNCDCHLGPARLQPCGGGAQPRRREPQRDGGTRWLQKGTCENCPRIGRRATWLHQDHVPSSPSCHCRGEGYSWGRGF